MRRGQSLLPYHYKEFQSDSGVGTDLPAKNKGIYQYRRAGQVQLVIFWFFFAF